MKPLSPTELKRLHRTWRRKTDRKIGLILDGVQQPFNVGSILRSAAAYGVTDVWLVPPSADPTDKKVQITAKGCDRFLQIQKVASGPAAVTAARDAGYGVVAIELTGDAIPLFDLPSSSEPLAIIVGHEERGVHKETLAAVDQTAFLPLVGNVGSLNVGHTVTAALAEVRRQGW